MVAFYTYIMIFYLMLPLRCTQAEIVATDQHKAANIFVNFC